MKPIASATLAPLPPYWYNGVRSRDDAAKGTTAMDSIFDSLHGPIGYDEPMTKHKPDAKEKPAAKPDRANQSPAQAPKVERHVPTTAELADFTLTPKQAEVLLKCDAKTIIREIRAGTLKALIVDPEGERPRYFLRPNDIEEYRKKIMVVQTPLN
jgi:hypothetical protein